jgi:hypothetical protein
VAGVKIDVTISGDDRRNDEPVTVQVSTREAVSVAMKMHGRTPFSGALAIALIGIVPDGMSAASFRSNSWTALMVSMSSLP